jgi:glycine cleavage system T protein
VSEQIPGSARVVIVGAGIAGASVAYHLTRQGWTDIVLVDQGPLWETGGSTSHAPGLVFQLNASRMMTAMARQTVALFGELEVDGQPCWHGVGGIEVAATEARMAELDRRWARARGYGLDDARLLTPGEVTERIPLVDPSRILGGFLVPSDGIAKAVRAAEALGRAAAPAGVRAFGGCEVTGFGIERGRVRSVDTTRGTIAADHVVIAAGIWGMRVARMAGLELPIAPLQHQYALTAPLPELAGETREVVHPILRHQDHSMYFRQHADHYGIGNYRHAPIVTDPEDIRPVGGPEQPSILPFTPEDFAEAQAETSKLLPALRGVEYTRTFNGLMSFTPDGFPLLGESGRVRGLWLAEAIWVTHSGGAGRALADLMTHGDCELDVHEADPQRFDAHGSARVYARARGAQGYREVYDIIHPRQQSEQVRGLRRTPFNAAERDLGAVFFESAGWERPQWYAANAPLVTDPVRPASEWAARFWSPIVAAEHVACRERVGMFDVSPFTKVQVSGPGALAYLQRLAANEVDRPVGTIVYTAMLGPRGGIMCDLTITRLAEDRFWVVTGGAVGTHDIAWMRRHLPEDGSVTLVDLTSGLCCAGVWGPRARDLLASVTEDDVSNEAFPYMSARELHVGPVPVRALRISYVGELGWEIYARAEFGGMLWDTLWEAGVPLGVAACGGGAYDSLRLEKGYRLWGQDIDEEHNAYEAGLGWAVRLGKDADFIGREAAARIKADGVTRRLCCMVTDDPSVLLVGKEPILDGSRPVGYVTSAGYGATVGRSILYGYLPVELSEPGTALSVWSDGGAHGVQVAAEPLFDPAMERLKDVRPAAVA